MRTLQELIKASREFSVEDRAKTWRLFATTLVVLFVCVTVTTLNLPWGIRLAASLATAAMILRMFMFYHDYLHDAIFRDAPVAEAILWLYGILILNPRNVWKRSHNYHHQNNAQMATAGIGSFPVMTLPQYERASAFQRGLYRAARHPITILMGYFTIFLLGMCVKSFLKDPKRHWDSAFALVFHVVVGVALFRYDPAIFFFSFWLPIFVSCAVGGYLFYIQHNFPGVEMRPREDWDYVFAALRSSSYMEGGPVLHWLTGNIGYHHVHHLNARIPFYRLPDAMKAIPELQNPAATSLRPKDIYACLSLKLWDPEAQRMVGFPRSPRREAAYQ